MPMPPTAPPKTAASARVVSSPRAVGRHAVRAHRRIDVLLDQAVERGGRAPATSQMPTVAADQRAVQSGTAGRRQQHADHRAEDDELHHARLRQRVELRDARYRRGRLIGVLPWRIGDSAKRRRRSGAATARPATAATSSRQFSITTSSSSAAAPPVCATATASGQPSTTFDRPVASCTQRPAAARQCARRAQRRDAAQRCDASRSDESSTTTRRADASSGSPSSAGNGRYVAIAGHAERAPQVEALLEIHRRPPAPWQVGKSVQASTA